MLSREKCMFNIAKMNFNYDQPIKLGEGVFWVGNYSEGVVRYNPYLIVEEDEAVVIDGGSRFDFPSVMLKILQTGVTPSKIKALIYHHYDPDRCGSLSDFEDLIDIDDLKIISEEQNLVFMHHYNSCSEFLDIKSNSYFFEFKTGRRLQFIPTPYTQGAGSFLTYDTKSRVLFSSELFGSYGGFSDLFLDISKNCDKPGSDICPLASIVEYHKNIFSSERALKYALEQAVKVPFTMVAPQRGTIITKMADVLEIANRLSGLKGVGVDGVLGNRTYYELGDISSLKERVTEDDS